MVSIRALSAMSKMLSSGVISAVNIFEAASIPFVEKKSIGEISVVIQPATIDELNASQSICLPKNGIDIFAFDKIDCPGDCWVILSISAEMNAKNRYANCMTKPCTGTYEINAGRIILSIVIQTYQVKKMSMRKACTIIPFFCSKFMQFSISAGLKY